MSGADQALRAFWSWERDGGCDSGRSVHERLSAVVTEIAARPVTFRGPLVIIYRAVSVEQLAQSASLFELARLTDIDLQLAWVFASRPAARRAADMMGGLATDVVICTEDTLNLSGWASGMVVADMPPEGRLDEDCNAQIEAFLAASDDEGSLRLADGTQVPLRRTTCRNDVTPGGGLTIDTEGGYLRIAIASGRGATRLTLSASGERGEPWSRRWLSGPIATSETKLFTHMVRRAPVSAQVQLVSKGGEQSAEVAISVPPTCIMPDHMCAYLNREGAGNPVVRAFAEGVGTQMRYAEDETGPRPGVPVVWGVLRNSDRVIRWAEAEGQYWYYIDHAYFERGHGRNYRITRNSHEARTLRDWPDDRLRKIGVMTQPWKRSGSIVLVCPPTDFFMSAHGCADWLETTIAHLARVTDRPIVVRTKPQPGETAEPLDRVFRQTHALVTHSSNIAVEAVVAGVPVFVSPTSAAASVGLTDLDKIETPHYPDRERWLAHLAYSQFSIAEIASGKAWELLRETELRRVLSC